VLAGLVAALVLLAGFVLVTAFDPALLTDPTPWLDRGGPAAAAVGVGLLLVDVAVPVPSSVVMVAMGALFGAVGGALLSLVGALGATLIAFGIGRYGRGAVEKHVGAGERERMGAFLARYGVLALVITRPIPLVAEAVAVLAGTTPMRWRAAMLGGVLGNIAPAVIYGIAGAHAHSLGEQVIVLGAVLLISAVLWIAARRHQVADTT
jgi:uncharacterized membrane protein YdjX (TVP38/TMEM64 family)